MRLDRLLAITVMLLNRDRISARELADNFEVTVRTIYRDIDALNMAGIPVVSFPGNTGGVGIMENYKLSHQLLTLKDMTAILSALKGVNTTLENRELSGAIEKIQSLVPGEREEELERNLERVVIDLLPWGFGKGQKEKLREIHEALAGEVLLKFFYRSAKGEGLERIVEPMTLILKGYSWYLFAWCTLRKDFRLFRLSRMKEVEGGGEPFERRKGSYRDYFNEEELPGPMVNLKLRFHPAVQVHVEDYYGCENITVDDEGNIIVMTSFPHDQWIYSHLLSFGEYVEVLEPEEVRYELKKKAGKILRLYE